MIQCHFQSLGHLVPRYLVCQDGALGLIGDWWLAASRDEAIETLSYGEIGSVDGPWILRIRRGYY